MAGVLVAILLAVIVTLNGITTAVAGITQSAHDFSSTSSSAWSGGKICAPCHTPHNADKSVAAAPLWNHELSQATYTLYSSATLSVTPEQPGGVSKLCLSCHDGTVALDAFGGRNGSTFLTGGPALIGTNLSDDHPVSIRWEHQDTASCSNCHNMHASNTFISPLPFFNRKVECATCHDPHNNGAGDVKMLRKPLAGSEICLHCHGK